MALQQEAEASNICAALESLLIARQRNDMSAWYTDNASGSLLLEVQRAQAALVKVVQLLLESGQWSGADPDFVSRVTALKERLEDLITAASA